MRTLKITISDKVYEAELYDTPTANTIYDSLPFQSNVSTWGEEIYCIFDVQCPLEPEAKDEVGVGELAYWPGGPAFCIFFGPTPASHANEPRAVSAVNIFGKIKGDIESLNSISGGSVRVEKS